MPSSPAKKAEPPNTLKLDAFRRYVELTVTLRELNIQKKQITPQLAALKPVLLAHMAESGVPLITVDGFTLSPRRVPWVYALPGVSRQTVIEALKLSGLGRYVRETFSTRSLTSYVEELEQANELLAAGADSDPDALKKLLPGPLAHVLDVRPGFDLQVTDKRKKDGLYETPETAAEEGDWNEDE